jgi:hypothetical protein
VTHAAVERGTIHLNESQALARARRAAPAAPLESVFARAAADWYVLSQSDVLLVPVPSAFSHSICEARVTCSPTRASSEGRTSRDIASGPAFLQPTGAGACALDRCFGTDCIACKWRIAPRRFI